MKLIPSLLLLLISLLLSGLLLFIGFLYALIRLIGYSSRMWALYFYHVAKGIDEIGNVVLWRLFNDILIKKGGYEFGMPGETISSALGKNVEQGSLTMMGRLLNWILNKIQKNHAILSINNDVQKDG